MNGSLEQIKTAAKEYDDILMICKNETQPGQLIILCHPDHDQDKLSEFINDNIPLGIGYEIREVSVDTEFHLNVLKEAFKEIIDEWINEKTFELMKNHSLSYGEAYSIVLTHFKKEIIDRGINPFQGPE